MFDWLKELFAPRDSESTEEYEVGPLKKNGYRTIRRYEVDENGKRVKMSDRMTRKEYQEYVKDINNMS